MITLIFCTVVLSAQVPDVYVAPQGTTWLSVESEPAGAEVFVDGELAGRTNLVLQVRPGKHEVKLRLEGYSGEQLRVECPPGSLTRVRKTLRAIPPQAPVTPLPAPSETLPTPRAEVERLIAEAVTAFEKGDIGAAQELLSQARQVADKCPEEPLRDWLLGEIGKAYAQMIDHAGAIECTLLIRRGARYCRVAFEVVALLAQQDPDTAELVYETLFPEFGTSGWMRVPPSVRSDVGHDMREVPESRMARKAIEEARKAHAEGRLPVSRGRGKPQVTLPSSPASSPPAPSSPTPGPSTSSGHRGHQQEGFVRLFNGEDLRGWRPIGQGRWDVEDGAIVGRLDQPTPAGGFLVYDRKPFGDFILRLKFKIPAGNSGIMIRSTEGGWAGLVGLQIDLDAHDGSATGSFFEVYPDSARTGRKVRSSLLTSDLHRQVRSEWTEMTIRAEGASITVTVAGQQTAQWPDYPGAREGLIALQLWGPTEVMFKDIEICEIGAAGLPSMGHEEIPPAPEVSEKKEKPSPTVAPTAGAAASSLSSPAPRESPRETVERLVLQAQEEYDRGDEGAAQESLAKACEEAEKISQQPLWDWVWKKIVVEGYAYIGHFGPIKELVYKIRDRDTRSRTGYEVALLQAWPHQQWDEAIRTARDLILQGGWGVGPDTDAEISRYKEAIAKIKELRKAWEEGKLTPPVRQRGVVPQPKEAKQPTTPSSPESKQSSPSPEDQRRELKSEEKGSTDKQEPAKKTPDETAWEEVDCLNKDSLREYLTKFPTGQFAQAAKEAIEMLDMIAGIKEDKIKPACVIPFEVFGDRWKVWEKRSPNKGIVGYFAKRQTGFTALGWFCPKPFSGGKTPGRRRIQFDDVGALVSPTGDGSVIAFQTDGLRFELFPGVVFETPGEEPMYFAVIEGKGLVHLKGQGKVTLPDGKTTELK